MLNRITLTAAAALALGLGASALAQEPSPGLLEDEAMSSEGITPEIMQQIDAMLAEMDCEVDPGNIEAEGNGYELDDVMCADGQYDIELDSELNVTNKRKE